MSDFTEHPLQKLLNRENIFSQVQNLKRLIKARPSAQITRLDEVARATGTLAIQGSLSVVNPDDGGEDIRIDDYGIFIRNQEGFIGFLSLTGTAIDDVGMYIDLNDNLTLKNSVGGKSILLDLYDVSHNVRSYIFNYDSFSTPGNIEIGGNLEITGAAGSDMYYITQPFHEGWYPTSDTCTQTGSYTFTMPGDRTAEYAKAVKFACSNSTNKYGVIASSAYVTTDDTTTVTLITNTSYLLTTDAITVPQTSRFEHPIGFPDEFAFTPSGLVTIGTGTQEAYWKTNGNKIYIHGGVLYSTDTAFAASDLTLPVAIHSSYDITAALTPLGVANYLDFGVAAYLGNIKRQTSTTARFQAIGAAGTYANAVAITSTIPITWGAQDELSWFIEYLF